MTLIHVSCARVVGCQSKFLTPRRPWVQLQVLLLVSGGGVVVAPQPHDKGKSPTLPASPLQPSCALLGQPWHLVSLQSSALAGIPRAHSFTVTPSSISVVAVAVDNAVAPPAAPAPSMHVMLMPGIEAAVECFVKQRPYLTTIECHIK